jgi:hypothetical protein
LWQCGLCACGPLAVGLGLGEGEQLFGEVGLADGELLVDELVGGLLAGGEGLADGRLLVGGAGLPLRTELLWRR